jgi:hypothetical protein
VKHWKKTSETDPRWKKCCSWSISWCCESIFTATPYKTWFSKKILSKLRRRMALFFYICSRNFPAWVRQR